VDLLRLEPTQDHETESELVPPGLLAYLSNMLANARWRARRLRSWVGLALLMGYGASLGEAATGVLRDGSVHHESSADAAIHQETSRGDHGHEDPGAGAEHGSGHQHGTSGDHCTHTHSMGLPTHFAFGVVGDVLVTELTNSRSPAGEADSFHFRPPKA
jgi:hypothetical protein